jgi:hypothetical protein
MKKYLFGLFALLLAVAISAFSNRSSVDKSSSNVFNWFDIDDNWVVTTSTPESPEYLCSTAFGYCIRGYVDNVENHTYPGDEVLPDVSFSETIR